MNFRSCLSVAVIWFLSFSQSNSVFMETLRCRVGESLSIEIPDDDQCPLSNFSVCTEKIGQVFEYSKKLSELTVDPRYQDRIQLKNDANGLAVVIWNVTKEDEKQQYYVDCASTILKRFVIQILNITESSTTTAAPQPSTPTRGSTEFNHHSSPTTIFNHNRSTCGTACWAGTSRGSSSTSSSSSSGGGGSSSSMHQET